MAFLPLRKVPVAGDAERAYQAWLGDIADALADPACDRNELCRTVLTDLYFPRLRDSDPADLNAGARVSLLQMDPRNVTLESEYYEDLDREKYSPVKPLLWLWEMFDKSPVGENIHVGIKFRRILAKHVFRSCGKNFKCFHHVKFSFGYNMEVGDGVVIHRHVLLDDRGGIKLGNKTSVADFANIYSHTHGLGDQRDVYSPATILGDGVRITYHATVLAGVHVADDGMVGAMALATKRVESGEVAVGIPAKPKFRKPAMDERPKHPRTTDPLAED
jgi:acetyltransferase-like isoleucine patch superfamily enzyme